MRSSTNLSKKIRMVLYIQHDLKYIRMQILKKVNKSGHATSNSKSEKLDLYGSKAIQTDDVNN